MIVNSHNIEFGYELIAVLPYAYWLHVNGKLEKTISGRDTECLYYFSPNHQEVVERRNWNNMKKLNVPNKRIHVPQLDKSQWVPPDLKGFYMGSVGINPDLVISNKYATEWGGPPVNFIDEDTLDKILNKHKDLDFILYNRLNDPEFEDHATHHVLKDFEVCKNYKNVYTIQQLMVEHKLNYNEIQVMAYAHCNNFISVQGGTSVISSYFGGKNTIYIKRGQELGCGSYNWYKDLSGAEIKVVYKLKDLI